MATFWSKLDSALSSMYHDYLRAGSERKLMVSLFYQGDLSEIETVGFRTVWKGPEGYATGDVMLSHLEQIAAHPGVVRMSFGQEPEPMLDISIPEINVRPDIWDWDTMQNRFVAATGKGTGRGVIVGVIDTGIDWQHPYFLSQTTPERETRILAIWDTGLRPESGEGAPDAALLTAESGGTYGVEYERNQINDALNDRGTVRHRDCNGHGTHVASIAAGSGGEGRRYIGVAPEADLIVVKYLYPQIRPTRNNDPTESVINHNIVLRDAITYILNKAQQPTGTPVVINLSLGSGLGPHDGFTPKEDWLTNKFESIANACFVTAAGNEAGSNQHATINFAAAGSIDIDIEFIDDRTNRQKYNYCEKRDETPNSFYLQLYYPPAAGPITVELDPKDGGAPRSGPTRGAGDVTATFEGYEAVMKHSVEDQPRPFTGAPNVQRSKFQLEMKSRNGHYRTGVYTLSITAPGAVTVHLWCQQKSWDFLMKVATPQPPILTTDDEYQIGYYGGADKIVTVAAYNAEVPPSLATAGFSSRGPLANYSGDVPVPKPDLGAPGMRVDAALSRETHKKKKNRKKADQSTRKQGTSMAAPHVAGVVALMLENNPTLTAPQIVGALRNDGVRPVPIALANELGQGRIDAKLAFDKALTP
jgi:minor extracellular serine protease Vpr